MKKNQDTLWNELLDQMGRNSTELFHILNRPKNTISEKSKTISKSCFLFIEMFEKYRNSAVISGLYGP